MLFSPLLVRLMAPGFAAVPGKFELAVLLTRIMFPFLVLVALAAQAMGLLNACDRYGIPSMASVFFNVGSLVVGLGLGFTLGRSFQQGLIVSMGDRRAGRRPAAIAVAGSGSLAGRDFRTGRILNTRHPGLRQVFRLMLPAFLGTAAVQINVIVNTNLASSITDASGHVIDGPVSWLGYAFRFMQLPLGIFGVAIASATLPAIARSAAVQRMDEFRETVARAVGMVLLLTIPSSVGLAILGESMIGAIYQWGRFRAEDTHQTALALACYAVGLAGYSVTKILAPAFYALNHAAIPMLVSLVSIAVNFAAAFSLVTWAGMGHAGLALSTSLVALFGAAALFWSLRSRTGGLHGFGILGSAWKITAASALMGAVCLASSRGIHAFAGAGKTGQLADVAISIPLGGLVFYIAATALRVPELEAVKTACYTAFRNAPRSEAGHPPSRNR